MRWRQIWFPDQPSFAAARLDPASAKVVTASIGGLPILKVPGGMNTMFVGAANSTAR